MTSTARIWLHQKIDLFQAEYFFDFDFKFSFGYDFLGLNLNLFTPDLFWFFSVKTFYLVKFGRFCNFGHPRLSGSRRQSSCTFFDFFLQNASLLCFEMLEFWVALKAPPSLIRVKGHVVKNDVWHTYSVFIDFSLKSEWSLFLEKLFGFVATFLLTFASMVPAMVKLWLSPYR